MQRSVIYIIILIIIVTASCSRRPGYVIPEEKMMDVLYDIQLSQAIFRSNNQFSSNEAKDALVAGVLKKHNVTQADLDSSLVWYSDNIQYYMVITDSVAARLKSNNEKLTALKNELNARTRNWSEYIIPPFYYLSESTPTLSFNIDSFKIKTMDISNFRVNFDVQGLNANQDVEAAIYYKYADTLIKTIIPIDENIRYTFSKPELADSLLKTISGYVHMNNKIKGLSSEVILYNISYMDSISSGIDSLTTLSSGNSVKREVILNDADRAKIRRDKMPVLSTEEVNSSPTMRQSKRSRSEDSQKQE